MPSSWMTTMRRATGLVAATGLLLVTGQASAATLKVCHHGCAYTQLASAVAAARDGDTVRLGAGTFAGGVTITASIELVGAGPGATTIRGGGPVLSVGVPDAASEPTVRIGGITVADGVAVGNLTPSGGRGGGIYIPRAAGPSSGATVTIRDSVIRGNRAAPGTAVDGDDPCCPFADSGGGGISNDGALTLERTLVVANRADDASGLSSNSTGGGILNRAFGTLTVRHSVVARNRAVVTPPNGRFASGGGIAMVGGALTMNDSVVSANTADATSALPAGIDQLAVGGGIQVQENASATIVATTISGNLARSTNATGDALAFSGGLHSNGPLDMHDSTLSANRAAAATPPGSPARAEADSGAGEINADSTITRSRFTANSVDATSGSGEALASAGASVTAAFGQMTISNGVFSANRVSATTRNGSANLHGAGIDNIGVLTLHHTRVTDNAGKANGPMGAAQGGGIYNGSDPRGPQTTLLALVDTTVVHNTLTATPGIAAQGGGIFALFAVTRIRSVIAHNVPDQCSGC